MNHDSSKFYKPNPGTHDCGNCGKDIVEHDASRGYCPAVPKPEQPPFDEITIEERAEWKVKEDAWRLYNARLQFACANRIAFPALNSANVMHRAIDDAKAFMEKCGG